MHLVIISGAARPQSKSNTAKVITAFQKGFEANGNTTEVRYLSGRRQWEQAANAFAQNDRILIAFPLYVENIPGILLEFLSGLSPKQIPGTKLAFLIQGGFPEASQSRCCEAFLETLPAQLGCDYAGTLIKGDMFGTSLVDKKTGRKCWLLLRRWDEPLPKPAALKRPLWMPSPRRNICRKSRSACTIWLESTFPVFLWVVSLKIWAARKNWMPDPMKEKQENGNKKQKTVICGGA